MTIYRIEGPWAGQLAIVPRPRGGDWLEDDVRSLKGAGFDLVVSLLTRNESRELGLDQEADLSREQGLGFREYPIRDLGIPDSTAAAQEFIGELHNALVAGKKVAIHCRQGIGRSGLIGSSLLVMSGIDPAQAFRLVSTARGLPVPETQEQSDWVMELSRGFAELVSRR